MFGPENKDNLLTLLAPIKKRVLYRESARWLVAGALWGLGGSFVLLLLARLFPIPFYKWLVLAAALAGVAAGMVRLWRARPTERDCARLADSLGLAERVATALEYRENSSPFAAAQREDAVNRLRQSLPHILESIEVWPIIRKQAYAAGGALAVCLLLLLWPNAQDERLAQMAQQKQAQAAAEESLKKLQEEAKAQEGLSDAQKKQLEEMIEQAKKAVAEAKSPAERLNAMKAAEKQLDKWKQSQERKMAGLQKLQETIGGQPGLQKVGAAMNSGDRQAMVDALKESAKAVEALKAEEQKALAEALGKAAEQLAKEGQAAGDEEAAKAAEQLQEAAKQLAQGNVQQAFAPLETGLAQAMQQMAEARTAALLAAQSMAAMQQSQMMLAGAGSTANGSAQAGAGVAGGAAGSPGGAVPVSASAGNAQTGTGAGSQAAAGGTAAGGAGSDGSGNANGQGSQNGNGSGNGNGAGNGNGSGNGNGNGNGNGSGNGNDSGNGSGSGSGSGKGAGAGLGQGSHELVTVPSARIGGEGPVDTVGGPLGEGASQSRQTGATQVSSGGALPYEEVYGQYAEFARESLEKSSIPSDYQDVVKEYFSNIEP
ncbi:hypothetical protein X546_00735 [Brevibacillus borstelensis cifa_chp40]|nr:hypothetical protein X546_00735 [Brevibacillus borstelensis cifa_chp40]